LTFVFTDFLGEMASHVSRHIPTSMQDTVVARTSKLALQVQQSHALSTQGKYRLAWQHFKAWLLLNAPDVSAYACNGMVISLYVSDLIQQASDRFVGPQLITDACAGIRFYYNLAGLVAPTVAAPFLCLLRRSADRVLTATKSRCEDITKEELQMVLAFYFLRPASPCLFKVRMHLTVFLLMFVDCFVLTMPHRSSCTVTSYNLFPNQLQILHWMAWLFLYLLVKRTRNGVASGLPLELLASRFAPYDFSSYCWK
jgi:hypothetical protein